MRFVRTCGWVGSSSFRLRTLYKLPWRNTCILPPIYSHVFVRNHIYTTLQMSSGMNVELFVVRRGCARLLRNLDTGSQSFPAQSEFCSLSPSSSSSPSNGLNAVRLNFFPLSYDGLKITAVVTNLAVRASALHEHHSLWNRA